MTMRMLVPMLGAATVLAASPFMVRTSRAAAQVTETRYFSFHVDPWINLHHFLYQWARDQEGLGQGRQKVTVTERTSGPGLTPAESGAWDAALAFYATRLAKLGEFDDTLLAVETALLGLGGDPLATPPDSIVLGLGPALAAAMPVYRAHWWGAHEAADAAWIAAVAPLVRAHEEAWVSTASRVYGCVWPAQRLRVDASAYGNWAGGYTSNDPDHTVALSTDSRSPGLYAMEIVFHESSHRSVPEGALRRRLGDAFGAAGGRPPGDLWHLLIFATAGEFTRQVAAREGLPAYVPYAVKEGLTGFSQWRGFWPVVEREWLPVVRGERSPEQGYSALARALVR
jgi:hypothetical protein